MDKQQKFDCIILGSGIGGSMLGAILSNSGLDVLLIDAGSHPRFAIGEATTPDTSFRLKLLGLKHGIPEIVNLGVFDRLRDRVSPACGIKRAFSFLYHRDGEEHDPEASHQYPTLAPPMGPDCHFFRQDTDAYMLSAAARYGATIRQQVRVEEFEFDDDGVTIVTDKGVSYRGSYLVDAAGFRSPLADKLGLREKPELLRTDSRTIFTHMVGVEHYDTIGRPHHEYGLKYPLSQSTLHHIFEGGWWWVIPFNNHDDAVNPLCSVGLVLNRRLHPESGMDAEEEFFHYANRFPSVARQFRNARAVRNWVTTGRMNYHSKQLVGDRYCLLAHAAGFIDPLFSSGLNMTAGHVDILADHLLAAFDSGSFEREHFQPVEDFFKTSLAHYDEVVGSAFVSFREYDLWDAWFRVWVVGLLVGTQLAASRYLRYLQTRDRSILEGSERYPRVGVLGSDFPPQREIYDRALAQMDAVADGEKEPAAAARDIRALYESVDFVPSYFRWNDPEVRTTPAFTLWGMTRMYWWYLRRSPRSVRRTLFDWRPQTGYRAALSSILDNSAVSRRRTRKHLRDVFKAWNTDWAAAPRGDRH